MFSTGRWEVRLCSPRGCQLALLQRCAWRLWNRAYWCTEMMDNWHPFNSHTGNVCHYIKTLSVIQNSISDYVPNFTSQYTDYKLLVSACKLQRCLMCRDWMMWSSCGIYPSCGICVIGISVSVNSVIIGTGNGFTWSHHLNKCWLDWKMCKELLWDLSIMWDLCNWNFSFSELSHHWHR